MMSATPDTSRIRRLASKFRAVCQRAVAAASHVVRGDARGIDDSALPSGYAVPYKRGSRSVRNLWHLPF